MADKSGAGYGNHGGDEGYQDNKGQTDPAREVTQTGRRIALDGRRELAPRGSVTVTLHGSYRGSNPLPLTFKLDGRRCQAEVLGATTGPGEPARSAA